MVVEQVDEEIFVVADREEASNSARNTFAPSFPGPLLHPVRSSSEERIKPMICESCERSSRISSDDWQGKTDKATTTERTNRFFPNVTGRPKSDSNVSELTGDVAHLSVRATDVLKPSVDNIRLTYRRYKLGDTPETTV
ncbi:hypothetical protein AB6A40_005823 [Gnathostoma spinigerum]|uniref:Uncharacterized protein n=1 Tax=Gnathostoma spinigerum TaxID=75299 RepID=A0ABD6EP81_9BILA